MFRNEGDNRKNNDFLFTLFSKKDMYTCKKDTTIHKEAYKRSAYTAAEYWRKH